jgi:putative salt-induced outer membrane protein YdiY
MKRVVLVLSTLVALAPTARAADPEFVYKDPTAAPPPVKAEKPTVWKASAQLGLVYVNGNARSFGLSASALGSVKHWNNEFTLSGGGAYIKSAVPPFKGAPLPPRDSDQTTAANWLAKGRYDRYFLKNNTAFVSFAASGDTFAGYDYRIEPQVGYARLFFQSIHQTFRGEIGYDYTYQKNIGPEMAGVPSSIDYHSGRLFLFYENKFTPYASFAEGLEALEAFNHLEGFRLNSVTSLTSTIYKNVALKVNFTLKLNNDPPVRPVNPVTMMQLDPNDNHFDKVDTQLDVVLAVTFI